ncbi:glycosyltransferase family 32 protein [Anaerocolumna sp. MB42-C2]|uniref:glycosyltransferase family 32 protein n=1 Tax=Anaerocolumna sp. MB42-C2 TaxID=3070997 RepID=UPI0027E0ADD0|nr:glycosyltransferase [Anaerocolumna sp. MB42-C2]WMJ85816.1 glycosyltransferase [Anaerocolumna sp. MB42-C2]
MIPKVINYCWFGGADLPELANTCIESWKKNCPDYEIKRWDESNFDYNECEYIMEAYKAKKWAFVSDYARFKILYENGGVYFDTDVELIRPIDDFLENGPFMGCEPGDVLQAAPGLGLAVEPKNELFKEIVEYYKNQKFLRSYGTENPETVVSRVTAILKKYGFVGNGSIEYIRGICIYPPEYFCPKNYYTGEVNLTDKTVSIHHYSATWHEPEEDKSYVLEQRFNRVFGIKLGTILGKPIHYYYRLKLRARQRGGYINALKYFAYKLKGG